MIKGELLSKDEVVNLEFNRMDIKYTKVGRQRLWYYNIPASYDIETTSFRDDEGNPVVVTYSHALNIDGYVFKMEEWDEIVEVLEYISEEAGLNKRNRMIIYIHNLSYEFQFLKKHLTFTDVFSNGSERDILYALTDLGIEFRCSYMLTGSNLAYVARNLTKYTIDKMDGDLDYNLMRSPRTPLTDEENEYVLNDVLIIEYHIREAMEEAGDITKLPLTSTGYVREYARDNTIKGTDKEHDEYRNLMRSLTLETEEYLALREAFAGGYTHGNIEKLNQTHENVVAKDFTSSYPGRMLSYQYPMGKGERYDVDSKEDFIEQINKYSCLFYIELNNITRKANEPYLSHSKANTTEHARINNGRIDSASKVGIWMTEIDFMSTVKSYDIGDYKIGTLYRYRRGYLPKLFIDAVIKLYEDKTELKDLEGHLAEYNRSKEMSNSMYGMIVMDVIQDMFEWIDEEKTSEKKEQDVGDLINRNNKSRNRFLYYPWGVWITAYARFDLFDTIVELGDDYIYSDTDSIYYVNEDDNEHIFEESNERILRALHQACDYHGYNYDVLSPKDVHGVEHTIGIWALDGRYKRFKTLGAKRYMVEDEDGINITVSGINKNDAVPYLYEKYKEPDVIFEAFDEDLIIPAGYAGKSTHTYIDDVRIGTMVDYHGESYDYVEPSGVHLEETSYAMSISNELKEMIDWVWKVNKTTRRMVSSDDL